MPPRCAELDVWAASDAPNGEGIASHSPNGGQGAFELGAGDFEMLEVGDYLRDLRERRCLGEVPSVTIADIVGEDEVE